jgi:hypothetical protein
MSSALEIEEVHLWWAEARLERPDGMPVTPAA